jgi:hypothetical protein
LVFFTGTLTAYTSFQVFALTHLHSFSPNFHSTSTQPSLNLHSTSTQPPLNLHSTFTQPSLNLHSTSTQPSLNLHSSLQVDAISVCKIRCIDVALQRVHALRMEVGSYALMHDTGFELVRFLCYPLFDTRFLCCQLLYILLRYTVTIHCYDTRHTLSLLSIVL